jgi:hypothetical protein
MPEKIEKRKVKIHLAFAAPRSMKITIATSDAPQGAVAALPSGPTLPVWQWFEMQKT